MKTDPKVKNRPGAVIAEKLITENITTSLQSYHKAMIVPIHKRVWKVEVLVYACLLSWLAVMVFSYLVYRRLR